MYRRFTADVPPIYRQFTADVPVVVKTKFFCENKVFSGKSYVFLRKCCFGLGIIAFLVFRISWSIVFYSNL